MQRLRTSALFFGLSAALACAGSDIQDDDIQSMRDGGPAAVHDAGDIRDGGDVRDGGDIRDGGAVSPSWRTNVRPLFGRRCSPCHNVGNQNRRIVVTNYAAIFSVVSPTSGMAFVTAGQPQLSYIYRKLTNTQSAVCADNSRPTRDCGGIMPKPEGTALTQAEIQSVSDWIAGGAAED